MRRLRPRARTTSSSPGRRNSTLREPARSHHRRHSQVGQVRSAATDAREARASCRGYGALRRIPLADNPIGAGCLDGCARGARRRSRRTAPARGRGAFGRRDRPAGAAGYSERWRVGLRRRHRPERSGPPAEELRRAGRLARRGAHRPGADRRRDRLDRARRSLRVLERSPRGRDPGGAEDGRRAARNPLREGLPRKAQVTRRKALLGRAAQRVPVDDAGDRGDPGPDDARLRGFRPRRRRRARGLLDQRGGGGARFPRPGCPGFPGGDERPASQARFVRSKRWRPTEKTSTGTGKARSPAWNRRAIEQGGRLVGLARRPRTQSQSAACPRTNLRGCARWMALRAVTVGLRCGGGSPGCSRKDTPRCSRCRRRLPWQAWTAGTCPLFHRRQERAAHRPRSSCR